jgi:TusA-related sulfurtransferase
LVVEHDARGLNCPLPVVRTKKALEAMEAGDITVLIERPDECQNVRRFAESQGWLILTRKKDKLKVEQVTNMYDTVDSLLYASKVVKI